MPDLSSSKRMTGPPYDRGGHPLSERVQAKSLVDMDLFPPNPQFDAYPTPVGSNPSRQSHFTSMVARGALYRPACRSEVVGRGAHGDASGSWVRRVLGMISSEAHSVQPRLRVLQSAVGHPPGFPIFRKASFGKSSVVRGRRGVSRFVDCLGREKGFGPSPLCLGNSYPASTKGRFLDLLAECEWALVKATLLP